MAQPMQTQPVFPVPGQEHERPAGDLELRSESNWLSLPEDVRDRCVAAIHGAIAQGEGPGLLARWRDQAARGIRIGSDDPWFHHSIGTAVRNICRRVLPDEHLPSTHLQYRDGRSEFRNWDDFYMGAIGAVAIRAGG